MIPVTALVAPGAAGDEDNAGLSSRAGIAFGGMGRGLFVADKDMLDPVLLENGIIDREDRPAGIAENDVDAEVAQRLNEDIGS